MNTICVLVNTITTKTKYQNCRLETERARLDTENRHFQGILDNTTKNQVPSTNLIVYLFLYLGLILFFHPIFHFPLTQLPHFTLFHFVLAKEN